MDMQTYDFKMNFSTPEKERGFQPGFWKGRFVFDEALFRSADANIVEDFENSKIFPDGAY